MLREREPLLTLLMQSESAAFWESFVFAPVIAAKEERGPSKRWVINQ